MTFSWHKIMFFQPLTRQKALQKLRLLANQYIEQITYKESS